MTSRLKEIIAWIFLICAMMFILLMVWVAGQGVRAVVNTDRLRPIPHSLPSGLRVVPAIQKVF